MRAMDQDAISRYQPSDIMLEKLKDLGYIESTEEDSSSPKNTSP